MELFRSNQLEVKSKRNISIRQNYVKVRVCRQNLIFINMASIMIKAVCFDLDGVFFAEQSFRRFKFQLAEYTDHNYRLP